MDTLPEDPIDNMITEEELAEADELLEAHSPKRGRSMDQDEKELGDAPHKEAKEKVRAKWPQVSKFPPLWGLLTFSLLLRPAYGVRNGLQPQTELFPLGLRSRAWSHLHPCAWPQEAEIDQEEDDNSPEGYIVMEQVRTGGKDKYLISREEIMIGFAGLAVAAGVETLSEDLVGFGGKFGPYEIYTDMPTIKAVKIHFPEGNVNIKHKLENGDTIQVLMRLRSVQITDEAPGKLPTCHLVAFLGPGKQRKWVRAYHIKASLKEAGLVVFRSTHQRVKANGITTTVLTEQSG